jgi:hypothetical protein
VIGKPFNFPAASGPKTTYATKPLGNLVRVRIGRFVDWNITTLAPRRTTIRRARRGFDSSCTASWSITSMVSPIAVGSLISMTVTAEVPAELRRLEERDGFMLAVFQ